MICPNCGNNITNGTICDVCGAEAVIFEKVRNAAIKLYNKGLHEAKNREISKAVGSLYQCVEFDKMNVNARNLLGLVYLEKGLVADALKHWIISASIKKENNVATRYMQILQQNGRVLEKYSDSITMYNNALKYIRQGSEDLAIIQLKKAVEFNNNFVDAHNLLALLSINIKDFKTAENCIEKVLKIDKNNATATRYFQEINPDRAKKIIQKSEKSETQNSPRYKKDYGYGNKKLFGKMEIIAFAIGVVVTSATLFTLVLPGLDEGKTQKIAELEGKLQASSASVQSAGVVTDFDELNEKYKAVMDENTALKSEKAMAEKIAKIEEASNLMNQSDFEGAALIVFQIDSTDLKDEDLARYNTIKETCYPEAAKSTYETGKSAFLNNSFADAKVSLEKALMFGSTEDFIDDTLFYLGSIAEENKDTENAKNYYNRVINEFPDSNQLKNAQNNLSALEQ